MKKIMILLFLSIITLHLNAQKSPRMDTFTTKNGKVITFRFYGHASVAIGADNKVYYIDPVSQFANYNKEPKAAAIFVTHSHSDHLDTLAIQELNTSNTKIYCDQTSARGLKSNNVKVMSPGQNITLPNGIKVEAVPAYNTTDEHTQFHPKKRKDCGYIFNIGGSRIYIAGDSEDTPEMKSLKNIDVAFLPVNQPYTMTAKQASNVIKAIKPKVFYPYHYGQVKEKTDIKSLVKATKPYTKVILMGME